MSVQPDQRCSRNHFVPAFYYRAWYRSEQASFWLYSRAYGAVWKRARSANSVGFAWDLYTLRPEGPFPSQSDSDLLEREFFGPIDNAAGQIHRKLINGGIGSISAEERSTWALFINSLLRRSPSRLAELQSVFAPIWDEVVSEYARRWPNSLADNKLQELLGRIDVSAMASNNALRAIVAEIMDKDSIEYIYRMQWLTVDLPDGLDHFLTSDTPVVKNGGGLATPIYFLSIALSPKRLLIMYREHDEFDLPFLKMTAAFFNVAIVTQTISHLVSSEILADGKFIKYEKIAHDALCVGGADEPAQDGDASS